MTTTKKSEKQDTTAADRYTLDAIRETTEMLARMGKLSPEDIRESQALRRSVGAKPLRLDDVREFDAGVITPAPALSPQDIKALREREGASQAVLARHLGVATVTLGQWERGLRKPDGPVLRLLSLVERHGLAYIR